MNVAITLILYLSVACITVMLLYKGAVCENKNSERMYFIFALVITALLAAFRGTTGSDSAMYRMAYESGGQDVFRWSKFEPGFLFLINVMRSLHLPYQSFFFIMQVITSGFIFKAILLVKEDINIPVAAFIYMTDLYMQSFNMMRQAVAVAIAVYVFTIYGKGRRLESFILIGIASLFHKSAIICFVIIFARIFFENKYAQIVMGMAFLVTLFLIFNRPIFGKLVEVITGSGYYAAYITRDAQSDGSLLGYFLKNGPIIIISLLHFRDYKDYPKMLTYFGLMICGYILSALGAITATDVQRIGIYFTSLNIVLAGYCCKKDINLGKYVFPANWTQILCIGYFLVFFLYNIFYRGFSELVPYHGLML